MCEMIDSKMSCRRTMLPSHNFRFDSDGASTATSQQHKVNHNHDDNDFDDDDFYFDFDLARRGTIAWGGIDLLHRRWQYAFVLGSSFWGGGRIPSTNVLEVRQSSLVDLCANSIASSYLTLIHTLFCTCIFAGRRM